MSKRATWAVKKAIRAAGNKNRLAEALGITWPAVYKWTRIPRKRLQQVAQITGLSVEELDPDLFQDGNLARTRKK
jgi:hypothetical protein